MSLITLFVGIIILMSLFVMILYVAFGQITVRRLRKNPETKNMLGIEFASGWDILNVAGALSRPKWLNERFKLSKLSSFNANAEILYKHTSLFDRVLARAFWYLYVMSGTFMLLVVALSFLGIVK